MSSCWSPVFWCNNGGTLLSHPPPPSSTIHCFTSVSVLWIPVEVPYFDVTMVELGYLTPPPPLLPPYIASYLCQFYEFLLKSRILMQQWWNFALSPPLFRPKLLHICVSFMNSCWSLVFWCNNGGTLLSHPTPSPIPPYIASCLSILWVPVEVPYFDVTMVELCYLTPPPLLHHTLLHICVSFVNSCWSPVFWCNNGGTFLSHPTPSPIPPYIASCLSILWVPVEVPYFDVTMVELCYLTPPPPLPPYIASHMCQFCEFLLKSRILM